MELWRVSDGQAADFRFALTRCGRGGRQLAIDNEIFGSTNYAADDSS